MPTTELVFPALKPDTAESAFQVLSAQGKLLDDSPGLLFRALGHIIRQNGVDVSREHRAVLAIEWDQPSSFHALFPDSQVFKDYVADIVPFMAAKSSPVLFQAGDESESSQEALKRGVTQIITFRSGQGDVAVSDKGREYVEAVEVGKALVHAWSGASVGADAEIKWVGILGWEDVDSLDAAVEDGKVGKALEELKRIEGVDEYVVRFGA